MVCHGMTKDLCTNAHILLYICTAGPSGSGGQFNLYNMAAQQSVQKWGDITFPYMTGGKRACMANDGDYLYVVGGYISTGGGKSRMLQMFNLTNMKWEFAQRDQLKRGRINPACVVHPDVNELWVFGGSEVTYSEYYQLPFKFDACPSRTWSDGCGCLDGCQHLEGGMVDGPDIQGIYHGVRAVVFEDFIILIGGSSTWSDAFWPSPNVAITDRIIGMNVHTQKLVEFGQLAYPVAGAAVVRLQGSIYVIGGRTVNHTLVDTIQEITVPIKGTMSPTGSPTLSIEYCCAAVSSKNKKAVRTCPIMETEAQCMKMKNRKMNISLCEWTVCADIGACKYDGVSAGNSRRMRKRCARKQSEDECTAKSGCVWSTGEDAMDAMIDAIDNGHVEEDMVDVKENVLDVEIESDVQEDGYKDLLYTMSGVCTVGLVVLAVYKKRKLSLQSETAGFSFGENEELDKVSVYGSI